MGAADLPLAIKPRVREIRDGAAIGRTFLVTDQRGSYKVRKGWFQSVPVDHDWRDTIRIGDVLRNVNGTFRVVRDALYKENGPLVSVTFTIKHCSWTGRCHTSLQRNDLKQCGFRPAGVRVRLDTEMDQRIAAELRSRSKSMDCCDVKGIA